VPTPVAVLTFVIISSIVRIVPIFNLI